MRVSTLTTIEIPATTLSVSPVCLGTNQFGTSLGQAQADELCDAFATMGGNFFDTAHSYGDWDPQAPKSASEQTLGRWLKRQNRSEYVIATKGGEADFRSGNFAPRVTPGELEKDLLASLEFLQVDYIDLFWLHRDDPAVPVNEVIDALVEHQQAGRIRYFGCSNWTVERIAEAQDYARSINHNGFIACQPMWGLGEPNRDVMQQYGLGVYYEDGFRPLHEAGVTMIPYSGQSRGVFTKIGQDGAGSLAPDVAAIYVNDANKRRHAVAQEVAKKHRVSVNEVVLAYLLCQPNLTIPIIGARTPDQLRESLRAVEVKLDEGDLADLREG